MKGKVERGELLICNSSFVSKAHVPKKVFETSPSTRPNTFKHAFLSGSGNGVWKQRLERGAKSH